MLYSERTILPLCSVLVTLASPRSSPPTFLPLRAVHTCMNNLCSYTPAGAQVRSTRRSHNHVSGSVSILPRHGRKTIKIAHRQITTMFPFSDSSYASSPFPVTTMTERHVYVCANSLGIGANKYSTRMFSKYFHQQEADTMEYIFPASLQSSRKRAVMFALPN